MKIPPYLCILNNDYVKKIIICYIGDIDYFIFYLMCLLCKYIFDIFNRHQHLFINHIFVQSKQFLMKKTNNSFVVGFKCFDGTHEYAGNDLSHTWFNFGKLIRRPEWTTFMHYLHALTRYKFL
jgi:hypothetical protein